VGRVLLLSRDLMFPSKVAGELAGAGIEVQIAADPSSAAPLGAGDLVVIDLTGADYDAGAVVAALNPGVRTMAYFSHVEPGVRDAALAAGVERVYPRSRVAREAAGLARDALA
jgi:small ligand-binding sensory domain FIST